MLFHDKPQNRTEHSHGTPKATPSPRATSRSTHLVLARSLVGASALPRPPRPHWTLHVPLSAPRDQFSSYRPTRSRNCPSSLTTLTPHPPTSPLTSPPLPTQPNQQCTTTTWRRPRWRRPSRGPATALPVPAAPAWLEVRGPTSRRPCLPWASGTRCSCSCSSGT